MAVSIDYLCFTMKVKDLRHCARATYVDTHQHDPDVKKKSRRNTLMINPIARFFPQEPVFNTDFRAHSADDIEAYRNFFRIQYQEYLDRCLSLFVTHVLGLTMNAPRGFGFQFYTESMKLTTADGEDFCGFVGIGGNQDTVHFQINGTGCKHVFAKLQAWELHGWLSNVLGVQQLARLDLAYDDYHGLFDCDYALKAAYEDAFRTASRGISPTVNENHKYRFGEHGAKHYSQEMVTVGSRTSRIYWRIYNKALEQNLAQNGMVWYRTECELKKWDIDALLNPDGAFAALNAFSASISSAPAFNTKPRPEKRVACDVLTAAYWMRRQYGKILNSLIEEFDGDIPKVIGLLQRDGRKFSFPDTYTALIQSITNRSVDPLECKS